MTPEAICELLNSHPKWIIRTTMPGVPADARVSDVFYDFAHAAFLLRVHHPTFPEIDPGAVGNVESIRVESKHITLPDDAADVIAATPRTVTPWEFLGPPPKS